MDYEIICLEKFKGKDWHAFGRRFLALLLACVLTFTSVPLPSLAESVASDSGIVLEEPQADLAIKAEPDVSGDESAQMAEQVSPEEVIEEQNLTDDAVEAQNPVDEIIEEQGQTEEIIEDQEPVEEIIEGQDSNDEIPEAQNPGEDIVDDIIEEQDPEEEIPTEPETEPTEAVDSDAEVLIPEDITLDTDRLTLELDRWWVGSWDQPMDLEDAHLASYADIGEDETQAGFALKFKAEDVTAGAYFVVRLPENMRAIGFTFEPLDVPGTSCELSFLEDPWGCSDLKVTFLHSGSYEDEVNLKFTMMAGNPYQLVLQDEEIYWVIPPVFDVTAAVVMPGVDPLAVGLDGEDGEDGPTDVTGEVTLTLWDWSYGDEGHIAEGAAIDFSNITCVEGVRAGVKLHIESAVAVQQGDYLTVVLPKNMHGLSAENVTGAKCEVTEGENGYALKVTLDKMESVNLEIPLSFTMEPGEPFDVNLGENTYQVIPVCREVSESVTLADWWFHAADKQLNADNNKVDFSAFAADADGDKAGVSLHVKGQMHKGDHYTVQLPKDMQELTWPAGDDKYEITKPETDDGYTLTVTILESIGTEQEGFDIPLSFTLKPETTTQTSDDKTTKPKEFDIRLTESHDPQTVVSPVKQEMMSVTKVEIDFHETADGIDWGSSVRPQVFLESNVQLVPYFAGEDGELVEGKPISVQDDKAGDPFYVKFNHDGQGGGSFEVQNIPSYDLTDSTKPVVKYVLTMDTSDIPAYTTDGMELEVREHQAAGNLDFAGTLALNIETRPLILNPTVGAEGENADFKFTATFTNGSVTEDYTVKEASLTKEFTVTSGASKTVNVPIGMKFTVTQESSDGYRLINQYDVTITDEDDVVTPSKQTGPAAEKIKDTNKSYEITTTNYPVNLKKEFSVTWVDDPANRPSIEQIKTRFVLKYQSGGMEEPAVLQGEDALAYLGCAEPGFSWDPETGKYAFTNLPSVDANMDPVTYSIELVDEEDTSWSQSPWKNYSAKQEANSDFTFRELTNFHATISWRDSRNAEGIRPAVEHMPLNLYRVYETENGKVYEPVTDDIPADWKEELAEKVKAWEDDRGFQRYEWRIDFTQLPKYQDGTNLEYEYVLVQGTMDENGNVTDAALTEYKTYYVNSAGTQSTDTHLCHNNGTIVEKADATTSFQATKVWNDEGIHNANRAGHVVTLWRYAVGEVVTEEDIDDDVTGGDAASGDATGGDTTGGDAAGGATTNELDDAFTKNQAAPVVYRQHTGDTPILDANGNIIGYTPVYSDVVQQKTLTGADNELIDFGGNLPKYDGNGRKYVYFVRETSDNENYVVTYSSAENGAVDDGFITNVRREKAQVNVQVEWKCPSDLDNLDDSTQVALKIQAVDSHGDMQELTVYDATLGSYRVLDGAEKEAATTVGNFNANITVLDLSFCVNIYDKYGQPFKMDEAQIKEIKIIKPKGEGEEPDEIEVEFDDNAFTLNGDQYKVSTEYKGAETEPGQGELKEFSYKVTNTITGKRKYELIKKWSLAEGSFTEDEVAQFDSVEFSLVQTSSAAGSKGNPPTMEQVYNPDNNNVDGLKKTEDEKYITWTQELTLDKYDENGYAYNYRATETGAKKSGQEAKDYHVNYVWTEDSTTAINYKTTGPYKYFTFTKSWVDNGDVSAHGEIAVRIYRKSDIRKFLETASQKNPISLEEMTGVPYYQFTMDASTDAWYKEIGLRNTEVEILKQEGKSQGEQDAVDQNKLHYEDYVALEYSVNYGDVKSTQAAQYSYSELYDACAQVEASENTAYSVDGTVMNSKRQYSTNLACVDPDSRRITITNKRIGQVTLQIDKTWKDPGPDHPAVRFLIERDGKPYNYVPPTDEAGSEPAPLSETEEVLPITLTEEELAGHLASDGYTVITLTEAKLLAHMDSDGYITVVTPNGVNKIRVSLKELPLFSDSGVQHTFNISEEKLSGYTTVQEQPVVGKDETIPDKLTYTYGYTNVRTGTTEHYAYKKWNDIATGGDQRPDLYFTLFQYQLNENNQKINRVKYDEKDPVLTTLKEPVQAPDDTEPGAGEPDAQDLGDAEPTQSAYYDMKVTVSGLPEFDAEGQRYYYEFEEEMSSDRNPYGIYVSSPKERMVVDDVEVDVFTNTLVGTTTLSGKKVWTGMDGYMIDEADLPTPTIELYRSKVKVNLTEANFPGLLNDHIIEKVDSVQNKSTYAFPSNPENELPKFAPDGSRFYYSVWESFSSDVTILDSLYTKVSSSGMLTNTFKNTTNRRKITVTKTWGEREYLETIEGQKYYVYPDVEFTLYRQLPGSAEPAEYASHKFTAEQVKAANGAISWTFDDLLVYAPNGTPYTYYVKETRIPGYTTVYTDSEKEKESTTDYADVTYVPENLFGDEAQVSTKNTYTGDKFIQINGSKRWNDYHNFGGFRPDAVTLKVRRSAGSIQNAPIDLIVLEPGVAVPTDLETQRKQNNYYLQWTKTGVTADAWEYTIHGLEQYAPNGKPYTYVIVEEQVQDGYEAKYPSGSKISVNAGNAGTGNTMTAGNLENKYTTQYTVRKLWWDGYNRYDFRPKSITVVLERKVGDGDWQTIPVGSSNMDAEFGNLPTVPMNDSNVVGKKLDLEGEDKTFVVPFTRDSTWQYTFQNLPAFVMVEDAKVAVSYRCVETMIGDQPITKGTDGNMTAGAYVYTEKHDPDAKLSILENTLSSTKLKVEKKWLEDEENMYSSQPKELEFVLEMKGFVEAEDGSGNITEIDGSPFDDEKDWEPVMVKKGGVDTPYTFKITAKEGWKKTLEDLPYAIRVEINEETGIVYRYYPVQFRARELSSTGNNKPEGAPNYVDKTSYESVSENHTRDKDSSFSTSVIRNQLIHPDVAKIQVSKQWFKDTDSPTATATFELLYRRKNDAAWYSFCEINKADTARVPFDEATHECADGCVTHELTSADSEQTFWWRNLPKFDLKENELEYKVVEHTVNGYATTEALVEEKTDADDTKYFSYSFTNVELQDYTVKKNWINADYAQKDNDKFTATFQLQQKIGDGAWRPVTTPAPEGSDEPVPVTVTLSTERVNAKAGDKAGEGEDENAGEDAGEEEDELTHTWDALPKYTQDGVPITYRAVETFINGEEVRTVETEINGEKVKNDTNGSYIVTYTYDKADNEGEAAHAGTVTEATNRMVYGFVNLTKSTAYLDSKTSAVNVTDSKPMKDVTFDLYYGSETTPYLTGLTTNAQGNLVCNADGSYGTGEGNVKKLIAGTYTLKETVNPNANADYSIWNDAGITFTVGLTGGNADTGEHGTAWISTDDSTMALQKEYLHPANPAAHSAACGCKTPQTKENTPAYNLESRGILEFTKTDFQDKPIDPHTAASGENKALFGVYLDDKCTTGNLVAYMAGDPNNGAKMVLKTQAPNAGYPDVTPGTLKNDIDLPYLRKGTDDSLSLLSGTYYVKELVAPAGYILDSNIRTATVPKLKKNQTQPYSSNIGSFADAPTAAWKNPANQVQLYKRDQYGRPVELGDKYLVLSSETDFMTGEKEIRLYQIEPYFRKANGDSFGETEKKPNITYSKGCWTIIGLLDAGKTYTISEPSDPGAPEGYILAEDFVFTMNEDGSITAKNNSGDAKDDPLKAVGNDFQNYYHSSADKTNLNQVVLRDPIKFRTNVILEKKWKNANGEEIILPNIAFELYSTKDGKTQRILPDGVYLVTDEKGQIDLSKARYVKKTEDGFTTEVTENDKKNSLTGCDLQYGLDLGNYYFREIEYGASDIYKLVESNINFSVAAREPLPENPQGEAYAKVVYTPSEDVDVKPSGDDTYGILYNTPVENSITLNLTKQDKEGNTAPTKMQGAQFKLVYQSINHAQDGAQTDNSADDRKTITQICVVGADGMLYLKDTEQKPDISNKGYYELTEVLAPDGYMTRTDADGEPVVLLSFWVKSDNKIYDVTKKTDDLVPSASALPTGENVTPHTSLDVTVDNEKTVVTVAKLSDILKTNATKSCDQENLNGEALSGAKLAIYKKDSEELVWANYAKQGTSFTDQTTATEWTLKGILVENTEYVLKEEGAPTGFMEADPIYFQIFGTTEITKAGTTQKQTVSQLYVFTGSAAPLDYQKDIKDTDLWSKSQNVQAQSLTMVDEAIIAPVDLLKKVGNTDALPGAKFKVTSLDDNTELGTAVTDDSGHLRWEKVKTPSGLVYNEDGTRITTQNMAGKVIILRENAKGYSFEEIYAPDHAWNSGGSYQVKITKANYQSYHVNGSYVENKYVDIITANSADGKTADLGSDNTALVNPPFEATFQLYKFDADHPLMMAPPHVYSQIGMKGVSFTLKRLENGTFKAVEGSPFTTGDNGLLEIPIKLKGTYRLREIVPDDYQGPGKVMEFTIVNDDYKSTLTYQEPVTGESTGATHTKKLIDKDNQVVEEASAYELPNKRKPGTLTLTKQDKDSGALLDGVTYILERTAPWPAAGAETTNPLVDKWFPENSLTVVTGQKYKVVGSAKSEAEITAGKESISETTATGQLIIEDLPWGTYTIKESQGQPGYILPDEWPLYEFTIAPGKLNASVKDEGTEFVNNTKNQLTIWKTDGTDTNTLKDAKFHLIPVKDDGTVSDESVYYYAAADSKTLITDGITAGDTTIYGLPEGTYVLTEDRAPAGYEKLTRDVVFTMNKNGTVTDVSPCELVVETVGETSVTKVEIKTESGIVELRKNRTDKPNTLKLTDIPIEISLTKKLNRAPEQSGASIPTNLGDAVYKIYGSKFADSEKTETDKDGTYLEVKGNAIQEALKAQLVGGETYTLKEVVAPAGYELHEPVQIKVGEDGTVTLAEEETVDFLLCKNDDGIAKLTYSDAPIELTLYKKSTDQTPLALAGAEFKITGKMVNATFNGIDTNGKITVTVGTTGAEIPAGRLIGGETYWVEEITPPDGYIVTPKFQIEVDTFGNIVEIVNDNVDVDGETLTVKDAPTVVQLLKVEDGNKPLAGAVFTLTAVNHTPAFVNLESVSSNVTGTAGAVTVSNDKTSISWTSTTSPAVITNMLIADVVYELKETSRIPNHEIMQKKENDAFVDDTIRFQITKDGKLEIVKNAEIPNNDCPAASLPDENGVQLNIMNPIIRGSVTLIKYWRKTDSNADTAEATTKGQTLSGAEYKLLRTANEKHESISEPYEIYATETSTGYAYCVAGTDGAVKRFETGTDGTITISGLPEGNYAFLETNAPAPYHINDADTDMIAFEIHNAERTTAQWAANANNGVAMNTRLNPTIKLKKHAGDDPIPNTVFRVEYWGPDVDPSKTIPKNLGTVKTDENGNIELTEREYEAGNPESLWRGTYRLTELSSPDQMMNTQEEMDAHGTITFVIDNTRNGLYVVAKGDKYKAEGNSYMTLDETGVNNTPIPLKSVTVSKAWENDLALTFQPREVHIELWRKVKNYTPEIDELVKPDGQEKNYIVISRNKDGSWPDHTWENLPAYVNRTDSKTGVQTTYLYEYYVKEVDVPDWYSAKATWETVPITGDEKVTDGYGNTEAEVTNSLTNQKLTINKILGGGSEEDVFHVRVKLWKPTKDGETVTPAPTGNKIIGEAFGVYLDSVTVTNSEGNETFRDPDSDDGWIEIRGGETITLELPQGIRYEVEEQLAEGSENAWSKGYDGSASKYQYVPRYLNEWASNLDEDRTAAIRNAARKSIKLSKVDFENVSKPLTGAVFMVVFTPADGKAATTWDECTINDEGVLVDSAQKAIDITAQGTYTIQETNAPVGYIQPTGSDGKPTVLLTLKVDENDKLSVEASNSILVTYADDVTKGIITEDATVANAVIKNKKLALTIAKVDQVTEKAIKDVTFQISRKDTETGETEPLANYGVITDDRGQWTTDDSGLVTFVSDGEIFLPGEYILQEISAPDTHNVLTQEFKFTIEDNGSIVMPDDYDGRFYESWNPVDGETKDGDTALPDGIYLQVRNPANSNLVITKQSPDGVKLGGVQFTLEYSPDGSTTPYYFVKKAESGEIAVSNHAPSQGGTRDTAVWTTSSGDDKGKVTIANMPDGYYKLTEIKTVAGYNLLSGPLYFHINRVNGTYQWKFDGDWSNLSPIDGNDLSVTVYNRKGLVLPATGSVTPQLPKAILGITAFLEGLVLFLYQRSTKRKRREAEF